MVSAALAGVSVSQPAAWPRPALLSTFSVSSAHFMRVAEMSIPSRSSTKSRSSLSRSPTGIPITSSEAIEAAGLEGVTIVSVDGGCSPGIEAVKAGTIGATSQQYPVKMAQLGVEAIAKFKRTGEEPAVTPGLDFFDTGVALVTDKPVDGVESIDVAAGEEVCWGK